MPRKRGVSHIRGAHVVHDDETPQELLQRVTAPLQPPMMGVQEFALACGISDETCYRMARRDRCITVETMHGVVSVPVLRFGTRYVIPRALVESLLTGGV